MCTIRLKAASHSTIKYLKIVLLYRQFFVLSGDKYKIYIRCPQSLKNDSVLLAHIKFILGTQSRRLGTCFGLSDDYRNVPCRLEII